jgi:hypothetical protein
MEKETKKITVEWRNGNYRIIGSEEFNSIEEAEKFIQENNGQNGGHVYYMAD